ncbi:uncharacterized protein LOC144548871 [Carex rostrata]
MNYRYKPRPHFSLCFASSTPPTQTSLSLSPLRPRPHRRLRPKPKPSPHHSLLFLPSHHFLRPLSPSLLIPSPKPRPAVSLSEPEHRALYSTSTLSQPDYRTDQRSIRYQLGRELGRGEFETEKGVAQAIIRSVIEEPWPRVSDNAKDLVQWMINPEPEKRLTAQQVIDHPWLQYCRVDQLIDTMRDSNSRGLEQVVVENVLSSTREQEGHFDEGLLSEVNAQLRRGECSESKVELGQNRPVSNPDLARCNNPIQTSQPPYQTFPTGALAQSLDSVFVHFALSTLFVF